MCCETVTVTRELTHLFVDIHMYEIIMASTLCLGHDNMHVYVIQNICVGSLVTGTISQYMKYDPTVPATSY